MRADSQILHHQRMQARKLHIVHTCCSKQLPVHPLPDTHGARLLNANQAPVSDQVVSPGLQAITGKVMQSYECQRSIIKVLILQSSCGFHKPNDELRESCFIASTFPGELTAYSLPGAPALFGLMVKRRSMPSFASSTSCWPITELRAA